MVGPRTCDDGGGESAGAARAYGMLSPWVHSCRRGLLDTPLAVECIGGPAGTGAGTVSARIVPGDAWDTAGVAGVMPGVGDDRRYPLPATRSRYLLAGKDRSFMPTITLVRDLLDATPRSSTDPMPSLPPGYAMRAAHPDDIPALGGLYFASYDPGIASATCEEAEADIRASFAGDYGPFWNAASPLILHGDEIVATIMVVHRAPWDDVPPCPFAIELFVARDHRRRGLARQLLRTAMQAARRAGARQLALRVDDGNRAALALYTGLGFRRVDR